MTLRPALWLAVACLTTTLPAACDVARSGLVRRPPVTIATASPGGAYHPVGNAVCRIVNLADDGDPDSRCQAIRSDGALANITRVRRGTATLGLTQSNLAYAAFRGEAPFAADGAARELRAVVALHRQSFTVIAHADAPIRNFEDLRGKRVGIGQTGAGYTLTRDVVLGFYGWTISDLDRALELGPAEQNQTLCSGQVDVIVFEAAHPDGLTQQATRECRAHLVRVAGPPIDRLLAAHPDYVASVVPGGLYDGNPQDTPTFGTQTLLVASAEAPDTVIYGVVKALLENLADFRRLHPALSTLSRDAMVPSEAVMSIHPGALRYYREVGLLP